MFSSNLKYLRKKYGMEQVELASKLGRKSGSTISEWEKGSYTPKIKVLAQIANIFHVDLDDLMNKDLTCDSVVHLTQPSLLSQITDTAAKLHEPRQKKVLTFAQDQLDEQEGNSINILSYSDFTCYGAVSAGTGEWLEDEYKEEVSLPTSIVPKHHFDFVLRVNGNSMEPLFKNHEYVFVKKVDEVRSGQIGVFIVDGEAYLKKAYIEKDHLRLVSLNKAYDDLLFDSLNDIKVVGVVVM